MANLGEFGAELAAVDDDGEGPDTFLFHGHEFRIPGRISSLPALRFAYNAQRVIAAEEQALAKAQRARSDEAKDAAAKAMAEVQLLANAGLYQYLRDVLAEPDDWDRFEQVAAQWGDNEDDLLAVAMKIMGAVAARPTRRSSGSPAGPSPTGGGSTAGSEEEQAGRYAARYGGATPIAVPEATPLDSGDSEPSPLERARAEVRAQSRPVKELTRSGR